jgi:sporulation protein YlmC with PRC-barrel domain
MIDLPMKAEVGCSDGIAGFSTHIIGNPVNHKVTHLVVKSVPPPFNEFLVPIDKLAEITPHLIKLSCTRNEFEKMEPFEYEEYIYTRYSNYQALPYQLPSQVFMDEVAEYVPVKNHNIPQGEITVWRGAKVEATNGYIGLVEELLINSNNRQATHLILRERNIFQQREIAIPVSQIERVDEDTIYLKLDRQSIEELPTAPIQRWQ